MIQPLRLGVSSCLLGNPVRFDGGHKHDHYITDTLGRFMEFVPVCPELECGMTVPREAMRLYGAPEAPRLLTKFSRLDKTDQLQMWAERRLEELAGEDLCGFIFKSGSPSSGMERVKIFNEHDQPWRTGAGLFARAFMERFPLLPVEDEGRLHDMALRENFITRIFTLKRWRDFAAAPSTSGLMAFHGSHKLLLLAHSPKAASALGKLVAESKGRDLGEVMGAYLREMLTALRLLATRPKHVNVLQHIAGYFKRELSPDEKQELVEVIDSYRQGFVPLIVPVTLLNHYLRKYGNDYLSGQWYLHPHPAELALRNHV